MGWNTGYTILEYTVIGAYNLGKLDKELLMVLMEPYRDSDIDSGGCMGIISKDGKGLDRIVIETWGLEFPKVPPGEYKDDPNAWDAYYEKTGEQMQIITKYYGWV